MQQKTRRHQFTFYESYFDAVESLPRSRRYETLQALILYALEGIYPKELKGASKGVFDAIRPNLDSSRVRAEKALRSRSREEPSPAPDVLLPSSHPQAALENKHAFEIENEYEKENENEYEYEYEKEIETEKEKEKEKEKENEGEGEGRAREEAPGPCPAEGDGRSASSLSARQNSEFSENFTDASLILQAPYKAMLREDPNLIYFWRALLDTGQGGIPLSPGEQRALLEELRGLPPWERACYLTEAASKK